MHVFGNIALIITLSLTLQWLHNSLVSGVIAVKKSTKYIHVFLHKRIIFALVICIYDVSSPMLRIRKQVRVVQSEQKVM